MWGKGSVQGVRIEQGFGLRVKLRFSDLGLCKESVW